jgi:hypothetical protein
VQFAYMHSSRNDSEERSCRQTSEFRAYPFTSSPVRKITAAFIVDRFTQGQRSFPKARHHSRRKCTVHYFGLPQVGQGSTSGVMRRSLRHQPTRFVVARGTNFRAS